MIILKVFLPISGILVAILGITLIFTTSEGLEMLTGFIGLAMILWGITELASSGRTKTTVVSGAVGVILGICTIFGNGMDAVAVVLPVFFAVWIMSASVPRIRYALSQRADGSPFWLFVFSFGVLGIVLGLLILFHAQLSALVVTYSLAFMFISYGVNNIITFCQLKREEV